MAAVLAESTQMQISMQGEVDAKARNKDLKKTKMCIHHQRGMCGLGTTCPFAHALSEIREAPNLTKTQLCANFMKGCCRYDNCTYAHGEAELVNPPSYKKKMCHWYKMGNCRNGTKCGFVHSLSEVFPEGPSIIQALQKPRNVAPPPGLKAAGSEYDYEASTNVPSSTSLAETDNTTMSTASKGSMPDENLYRMVAGRGSAPLQHQVVSMGLAIADLQAKLSQVEGKMAETQVAPVLAQMQQTSNQLVAQCKDMDAHMRKNQQPAPTVKTAAPWKNARPRERSAPPLKDRSDAPPARKVATATKPSASKASGNTAVAKKQQFLEQYGVRAALGVLVLALMAVVELTLNK